MNARERMAAAMRHEIPDRVPVMCQLALGHYFLHAEAAPADIWFDSRVFAEVLEEFRRRYRFDGLLVNLPGRPENWRDWVVAHEADEFGETMTWTCGLKTRVPADDNLQTFPPDCTWLPRADLEKLDPGDDGLLRVPGLVWNTWHAPCLWDIPDTADLADPADYPAWFTRALRAARQLSPEASVHAEVFSPFTHLMELLGYEQAMTGLIDAPEVCTRLLDRFTAVVCAQVDLYADCRPDAVLISSAFAGAGFISQEMYRRFVLPAETRVVRAVHRHGLPAYVHTCGAIGDRMELMAESGVDGIDTLDPPPLGTVDLAWAKERFGQRFFFQGQPGCGQRDAAGRRRGLRAGGDPEAPDRQARRRLHPLVGLFGGPESGPAAAAADDGAGGGVRPVGVADADAPEDHAWYEPGNGTHGGLRSVGAAHRRRENVRDRQRDAPCSFEQLEIRTRRRASIRKGRLPAGPVGGEVRGPTETWVMKAREDPCPSWCG